MKAVLCKSYGPPENLVLEQIDAPNPDKGQVLLGRKECLRLQRKPKELEMGPHITGAAKQFVGIIQGRQELVHPLEAAASKATSSSGAWATR